MTYHLVVEEVLMRVLICGSRNWTDREAIRAAIAELPSDSVVIHGAARGADTIAGEEAASYGIDVIQFPADWTRYGKAAGPIRNKEMLLTGKPDQVWVFHNDLGASLGTKNMVLQAKVRNIPIVYFKSRECLNESNTG